MNCLENFVNYWPFLKYNQRIIDITKSYHQDSACKKRLEQYTVSPPDQQSHYTFHSGILRYKGRILVGNSSGLREQLFSALHSSAIGGHSGMRATYHRLKKLFYWTGMKLDVNKWTASCPVCQRSKHEQCHYPGLLDPLPILDMAWTHISMDFIEGLPKSNGKEAILVVVDRLTKYAHFIPLAHPYTLSSQWLKLSLITSSNYMVFLLL